MRKLIAKIPKDLVWALHIAGENNGWVEPHWLGDVEWFFVYVVAE